MNDFDDKLAQGQPQPRRPLSADFTSRIVTRLGAQPKPLSAWAKAKDNMKLLFKKPAFIIAALTVMALGGTAYATTDGFTKLPEFLNAKLGKTETLKSGDRIVQVNTDCKAEYFASYNPTASMESGNGVMYYRVQKDSTLTPEQVVQTVQGMCENSAWLEKWNPVMVELRTQFGEAYGGAPSEKVVASDGVSLTVSGTTHRYMGPNKPDKLEYTIKYANIGAKLQVYAPDMTRISLADIKPGQHVQIAYSSGAGGLGALWNEYSMGTATDTSTPVVAIFVISENTAKMFELWDQYGFEFQQVRPCDNNPKEWCEMSGTPMPTSNQQNNPPSPGLPVESRTIITIDGVATDEVKILQQIYQKTLNEGARVPMTTTKSTSQAILSRTKMPTH